MITGTTKIFYMLAHPISHVRTPELINPLFAARGIDAVMVPVHFAPEDFAAGWDAIRKTRNLGGLVVSVPHKEHAYALADEAEPAAEELGAANVIRREADGRMIATNMDGPGFLKGMLNDGRDAANQDVLLIGAGGAGKAIAFSLARSGCNSLRINDTDAARATALAEDIKRRYPHLAVSATSSDLEGISMLVNATPCGLHPETDPLPVDIRNLQPNMLVADIIMKPRETPLLKAAMACGCQVRYGAGMLDTQIELMISYFGY
ncbi:shikimate dehydrogenase (plasmid) [Rhizobium sp. CB3090]|uniref:shikimate dehydrogenase family protein n=1 Tax=Rhizobium sp. CB3090 TaxID=3039156 RepID=UPI0024B08274|nr:shikimate dehydrogenase [Rhizobium sp. CB3090]WFU11767.1 shikimate dehydrogenase [Rhizobium sp. CB3090]